MSNILDEITIARKRKRRRYHLRRFIAVISLFAILIPVIILVDKVNIYTFRSIKDFFETTFASNKGYPAMLNSSKPSCAQELKGATAVVTSSELIIKGNRGAELFRHTHGYSNPLMNTGKTRVILYDSGNKNYSIYNRTGEMFAAESEFAIVSAAMANNSTAAVLTRGERSFSQLEVLSSTNYLTSFTWLGVTGFPLSCNFSEDSKEVYVVTLNVNSREIISVITFIDVEKRIENAEVKLSGIVLEMYNDRNGYTAVTDKGVFRINQEYEIENRYMLSHTPILAISKSTNHTAIAFGDNNKSDINYIVILSNTLEELTTLDSVGAVDNICMTEEYLYLLSSSQVHAITKEGEYMMSCDILQRAKSIFLIKNKPYMLLHDRIEPLEMIIPKNKKQQES